MPFRRFKPGRGYYDLLPWKWVVRLGILLLFALAAAMVALFTLFSSSSFSSSSPPSFQSISPAQQNILDAVNCLRQEVALPPLRADNSLMEKAQDLANRIGSAEKTENYRANVEIHNLEGMTVYTSFTPDESLPSCANNRMIMVIKDFPPVVSAETSSVGIGFARMSNHPELYVLVWLPGR